MRIVTFSIIAIFSCVFSSNLQADLILGFSADNQTSTLNAIVGQEFEVPIYVIQTDTETRLSEFGLSSFDFKANYQTAALQTGINTISANFDFLPDVDTTLAGTIRLSGTATAASRGQNATLLGTLRFTPLVIGQTTIQLVDSNPSINGKDFILNDGTIDNFFVFTSIDDQLFGNDFSRSYNLQVNVSAIPEPSSVLLFAIGLGSALGRRYVRHPNRP